MNGKEFLVAMTNLDEDLIMDVMPRKIEKLRSAKRMTRWHIVAIAAICLALVGGSIFLLKSLSGKDNVKPTNVSVSQSSNVPDTTSLNGEATDITSATESRESSEEKKPSNSIDRDACQYGSAKAEMRKIYVSKEDLENDAELIVVGTVIRQENYYSMSMLYQYAWIEVEEVLAGNALPGETIRILQMGGYATYKEWIENTEFEGKPGDGAPTVGDDQMMAYGTNGYYPVVTGDKVLLYLQKTEDPRAENIDDLYYPVGDYFGVFYWSEERNQFVFPQPYADDSSEVIPWEEHLKNNPLMTVDE